MAFSVDYITSSHILVSFVAALTTYAVAVAISRAYFSPLSVFPGPKLAAISYLYEFYYDWWLNGQYIFEIGRLHKKYGIILVNPTELSINDPDFYNGIYVTSTKRRTDSYDVFCLGLDFDGSHFMTVDHDLHRMRRKPLEPFFSRMGVSRLQSMLAEVTLGLEARLRQMKGQNRIIRLDHAFSAFSGDVIGRVCLSSQDGDVASLLDDPNFAPEWYDVIHTIVRSIPLFTFFPWIVRLVSDTCFVRSGCTEMKPLVESCRIASYLPERFLLWVFPQGQVFNIFKDRAMRQIQKTANQNTDHNDLSLFHRILRDGELPQSERSVERLAKEAQTLLGAGTASTSRTIGFASYYILYRPDTVGKRLKEELGETMKQWPRRTPTWAALEQLPYLQAIIKESLRLNYGVMHRLPRVSPDLPIQYKQYTIPAGIPVGMSAYLMHSNPKVYDQPEESIPERWLETNVSQAMLKSFVPFSKGSRQCLGVNLAMAEMSLVLAVLYRPGGPEFELYETDESDVKHVHDFLIPLPKLDTKGVRALIR